MPFALGSYRSFAVFVGLFLLVAQVVAVPVKVRKPPIKQTVAAVHKNTINTYQATHQAAERGAYNAHESAKSWHTKLQHANAGLAVQHDLFAPGIAQPHLASHYIAAAQHRGLSQRHLNMATAHGNVADRLRVAGHAATLGALRKSKKNGQTSIANAKFASRHTERLDAAMSAAREHRIAATTHEEARNLAAIVGGNQFALNYHLHQRTQHRDHTAANAKFAALYTVPRPFSYSVDEAIKRTKHSAQQAYISNQNAHASIQRSTAALANSNWQPPVAHY